MSAPLKVSARSNPNAVAGAFAGVVRDHGRAEICVIGAGALNQAVKAVAIARGYLEAQGIDLVCIPSFCDVEIDGETRTGVRLVIESRQPAPVVVPDVERVVDLSDPWLLEPTTNPSPGA